jgi:hypothetical protein
VGVATVAQTATFSSIGFDRDAFRIRMTAANVPFAPDAIKFETPARRVKKDENS